MVIRCGDVLLDTKDSKLFFVMSESFMEDKGESVGYEILDGQSSKTYRVSGEWMRSQIETGRLKYQGLISPSPNFGFEMSKQVNKIYIKQ